jgi:hypothetical protein
MCCGAFAQGLDKGNRSVGKSKVRFRKAPKSDNVYIKLLVKVPCYIFSRAALPGCADPRAPLSTLPADILLGKLKTSQQCEMGSAGVAATDGGVCVCVGVCLGLDSCTVSWRAGRTQSSMRSC